MCAVDAEREVRVKAVECLKSALARLETESAKMNEEVCVRVCVCACVRVCVCACMCVSYGVRGSRVGVGV
jgi:hypothetical protein